MSRLSWLSHLRLASILTVAPLLWGHASVATTPEPAPTTSGAAVPTSMPGLEELVDKTVMPPIERGEMAGAVVTVVKDGQVVLLKGYGHADVAKQVPVDPAKTLFRIGSITKTFTWTALMQLLEQGKIGLDQPIEELLPQALHPAPSRFDAQPILVRHLFTHTGGFEDKVLNRFFLRDPQRVRPLQEELTRYKPLRIRPPGVSATYSNYGAALAGAIVEHVAAEPYADYIDKHILTPLAMTSTTAREPLGPNNPQSMSPALASRLTQGYVSVGGKLEARPFEFMSQIGPAGSISSTGADMGKYLLAQLHPGSILSAPSATRMQSRLFTNAPQLPGIGYGWALDRVGSLRTVWHNGGTMAFHSMLLLAPDEDLGIFISTNTSSGDQLSAELPKAILTTYFSAARDQPRPIQVDADTLQDYRGAYLGDRLSTSSAERFFIGLIAGTRQISDGPSGLTVNGSPLVAVAHDVFGSQGGNFLVFQRDQTGHISGFTTGIESFDRLPPWRTPLAALVVIGLSALLSLVNLWSNRNLLQPGMPRRQKIALALNLGASLGWLAFAGCLVAAFMQMMQSPLDVVFTYPSLVLTLGLWIGVCAALLSVAASVSALTSVMSSSWPRRIQYAASAIVWATLLLLLHDWRLLGLSA